MTGVRVSGADAAVLGLATYYVARDRMAVLADAIAGNGIAALDHTTLPKPATVSLGQADVVNCFGAATVAGIVEGLASLDSAPARDAISALRAASPIAVLQTFELMRRNAGRTLEQCLASELALTRHAVRHPDFAEGVRAMVVDKDRDPHWSPAKIEDVPVDRIKALFRQLGDG